MSKHHHERLNFSGANYYGALSTEDGFGGFNYASDMEYMDATFWENIDTWLCDNGWTNVTAASKDAVGCAWVWESSLMESANLKETFSLKSMIAASGWNTNAVWDVKSYTYANGSLSLKASDTMTLSETATKINFNKLGAKGDFTNIAAVLFELSHTGWYG